MPYIKHLLDETKSNIRFVLPGKMMFGQSEVEPDITWPGKTNLMLDEVEFKKCFIIPKHTLGSNQLQTGYCTCDNDKLSQFPCLLVLV